MGILKVLFIIFLLLFSLGEIAKISLSPDIAVTINDIFAGCLFVYWLCYLLVVKNIKVLQQSFFLKPFLAFLGVGILSLLVNLPFLKDSEFFVAFLYLIRWGVYASLVFVISSFDKAFLSKIKGVLLVIGSIVVFFGYVQYIYYPSLRNLFYLGWDEHLYRMFGSFLDPNFIGAFFTLFFLFVLGLCKKAQEQKQKLVFFSFSLLLFIIGGALLLTYSRSALLMFIFSVITFLILTVKRKSFIGGFLVLVVISVLLLPKSFQTEGTNFFRIASTMARLDAMENAVTIFSKQPILGVGFNAYRYAQIRYGFVKKDLKIQSHADSGTDNSFLFVLATTGIVGFSVYLYFWYCIIKKVREQKNKLAKAVFISSCIGLFIHALFVNSLFYTFLMEWIFIILGLTLRDILFTENNLL